MQMLPESSLLTIEFPFGENKQFLMASEFSWNR